MAELLEIGDDSLESDEENEDQKVCGTLKRVVCYFEEGGVVL